MPQRRTQQPAGMVRSIEIANEYPDNWPEIALQIKKQAGWRCVRCKHPDNPDDCTEQGIPRGQLPCDEQCRHDDDDGKQRVLTVHHLDLDKSNCEWWNLPPLCQACHLRIQGKVNMKQDLLFDDLHSDWFKPFLEGRRKAQDRVNLQHSLDFRKLSREISPIFDIPGELDQE